MRFFSLMIIFCLICTSAIGQIVLDKNTSIHLPELTKHQLTGEVIALVDTKKSLSTAANALDKRFKSISTSNTKPTVTDLLPLIHGIVINHADSLALNNRALKDFGITQIYPARKIKIQLDESVPMIGAPEVWEKTGPSGLPITGHGIKVAVIDTGVDYTHPDLGGCASVGPACKIIGGYDFYNEDDDPIDDHGHGTHVAGIIAANGKLKGVAPDANILAYKVLNHDGEGSEINIIKALQNAYDDGAHIVNLSLGTDAGNPADPLAKAVDKLSELGVIVVAAAGNSGPDYGTIASPALAKHAIAVAASSKNDEIANFSARGPVSGASYIKPDITAPGVDILSTTLGNDYKRQNGTSMASPHVAGAVALIQQAHPELKISSGLTKNAALNHLSIIKSKLFSGALALKNQAEPKHLLEQGVGRLDIAHSFEGALLGTTPHLLDFGALKRTNVTEILTEYVNYQNTSEANLEFTLSNKGLPNGLKLSFSPNYLKLIPGQSASVKVSLEVDNTVLKPNDTPPYTTTFDIAATNSAGEVIHTQYASVENALMLNLIFKFPPMSGHNVAVIGEETAHVITTNYPTYSLRLPPGEYDLISQHETPADNYFIATENLLIQGLNVDKTFSPDLATLERKPSGIFDVDGTELFPSESRTDFGLAMIKKIGENVRLTAIDRHYDPDKGFRFSPMREFELIQTALIHTPAGFVEYVDISENGVFGSKVEPLLLNAAALIEATFDQNNEQETSHISVCLNIMQSMDHCHAKNITNEPLKLFLATHDHHEQIAYFVDYLNENTRVSGLPKLFALDATSYRTYFNKEATFPHIAQPIKASKARFYWNGVTEVKGDSVQFYGAKGAINEAALAVQADSDLIDYQIPYRLLEGDTVKYEGVFSGEKVYQLPLEKTVELDVQGSVVSLNIAASSDDPNPPTLYDLHDFGQRLTLTVVEDNIDIVDIIWHSGGSETKLQTTIKSVSDAHLVTAIKPAAIPNICERLEIRLIDKSGNLNQQIIDWSKYCREAPAKNASLPFS